MRQTTENPRPFAVMMTDEEFEQYHETLKKEQLLDDLLRASNKSFSVKSIKKKNTKQTSDTPKPERGSLVASMDPSQISGLSISDDDWKEIVDRASNFNPSPIDDITSSELGTFRLEDSDIEDPNSYDRMFKKEQSMLAELLKDVTEQARAANSKLKDMTKKSSGYGGVSKSYSDLLSASNSLNSTRLSIVKQMIDTKKTIVDLNLKRIKDAGGDGEDKDNEIADGFFNKILSNRKEFIDASMNGLLLNQQSGRRPYAPLPQGPVPVGAEDIAVLSEVNLDQPEPTYAPSRSITSPLMGYQNDYSEDDNDGDPYGYIKNEDRDVSICVQRFQDGRIEFVALDGEGEGVYDYELPDDDLLLGLEFRIGSQFATDAEGRRYRIIDVDPEGVDISDILNGDE